MIFNDFINDVLLMIWRTMLFRWSTFYYQNLSGKKRKTKDKLKFSKEQSAT